MMNEKIEEALNKQINNELVASYNYLAMAAYFDRQNLGGFAEWMQKQSDEERGHAHRLFRYVLDREGNVVLEAVEKPENDYGSIKEVFSRSLEQEKKNTADIYKLYELARELNDYATVSHLQWMLDEQVEEEKTVSDILGRLGLAGDDKTAILILDDQMRRRSD